MVSHAPFADVEDRDGVGMIERGRQPGLANETHRAIRPRLWDARRVDAQDFESDAALEALVVGAVHLAHAPFAEQGLDLVPIE